MKKTLLTIIVFLNIVFQVVAHKRQGVIETVDGRVIETEIQTHKTGKILTGNVKYYDREIKKKIKLEEIAKVRTGTHVYKPMHVKGKYGLYEVVVSGPVLLLRRYNISGSSSTGVVGTPSYTHFGGGELVTSTYLMKDGKSTYLKHLNYKKHLLAYFNNCVRMKTRLDNQEFTFSNLEQAVRFGNKACQREDHLNKKD